MIWIRYSPSKNKDAVLIGFNGPYFDDINAYCKSKAWKYNPEEKAYEVRPKIFIDYDLLSSLKEYDEVGIERHTYQLIKQYAHPLQKVPRRFKIDPDVIDVPPLMGLPPNENFQMDDLKKGLNKYYHYFAWKMGLGKSWLMVNIITQLWTQNKIDKVVILVKPEGAINTKIKLIKDHINSFSSLFTEDEIYVASTKAREPFQDHIKVVICPYHMWRIICESEREKVTKKKLKRGLSKFSFNFDKMGWGTNRCIMLDEADELGNHKSKQSKAVMVHIDFFKYRYLFSGTPSDNTPVKWFNQIRLMDKNIIPVDYDKWLRTIGTVGTRYSEYDFAGITPDKYELFKTNVLRKHVTFRDVKDHMTLPENYIKKIYCELSEKQLGIYQSIVSSTLTRLKEDKNGDLIPREVQEKFPFLIKGLDNPSLLIDDFRDDTYSQSLINLLDKWTFEDHSKLDVLNSILRSHLSDGHKVILWSYHPSTIDSLVERYKEFKPFTIHGKTKIPKGMSREEFKFQLIGDFQKDPKRNLGIFSQKSLKTSVDITNVQAMIYFDRGFDVTDFSQSMARVHRYGLKNDITTYLLLFANSLDIYLDKMIEQKNEMKQDLFDREFLTKEEWQKVFKGDL